MHTLRNFLTTHLVHWPVYLGLSIATLICSYRIEDWQVLKKRATVIIADLKQASSAKGSGPRGDLVPRYRV
jgi:hypothetical protein